MQHTYYVNDKMYLILRHSCYNTQDVHTVT